MKKSWQISCKEVVHFSTLKRISLLSLQCHLEAESPWHHPSWNHEFMNLSRASSSFVYSQYVVHIVVGPCAKGHFIHVGPTLDPEFFFFFFYEFMSLQWCFIYLFITQMEIVSPIDSHVVDNNFWLWTSKATSHCLSPPATTKKEIWRNLFMLAVHFHYVEGCWTW
jgi:hypothetical protein